VCKYSAPVQSQFKIGVDWTGLDWDRSSLNRFIPGLLAILMPTQLASPAMNIILERLYISPTAALCQGDISYMPQLAGMQTEWHFITVE